jgi:autotransporter-associated beta strand protein
MTTSRTRASLNLQSSDHQNAYLSLVLQGTLTLSTGGILSSGSGPTSISGSSLTSGNELIITNDNALDIGSYIFNSTGALSVTKSGSGTLRLLSANSYTGPTTINEGVLAIYSDSALGASSSGVVFNGGTLQALGNLVSARAFTGSPSIDTNGHTVILTSPLSSVTKSGAGTLALAASSSGAYTVTAGSLNLPNSAHATVQLEGGSLSASGTLDNLSLSAPATLTIGGMGNPAALTLNGFSGGPLAPLTVNFDLGSASQDALTFQFFGGSAFFTPGSLLFEFHDLGGLATGIDYTVISLTYPGGFSANAFALAPDLVAAGWQATFTTTSNAVTVNFSAVPEPDSLLLLGCAGLALLIFARASRASGRGG